VNELAVQQANLPAMPTESVKQYIDDIGTAINVLKAKRSVAKNMNISQSDIDEIDRQIRVYNAEKVLAQMELGKRTAEMETNITGRGDKVFRSADDFKPTKSDQLADLGVTPQRANEYEQMAKHEETVTQYVEEKLSKGETPTKNGAMARIKEEESYIDVSGKEGVEIDKSYLAKRENAIAVLNENSSVSNREVARKTGLTHQAVARVREEIGLGKSQHAQFYEDEEAKERRAAIDAAVERITNPGAVPEYTLDDLLNELQENASSFVSMVRRTIAIRSNVLSDEAAREKVRGAIEANIINKIKEIERLV